VHARVLVAVADGVSREMVPGRVRPMTGSGRTRARKGGGPIIYPTCQFIESRKLVETVSSLYIGLKKLPKLVWELPYVQPNGQPSRSLNSLTNIGNPAAAEQKPPPSPANI
jgi:hypothetical protein